MQEILAIIRSTAATPTLLVPALFDILLVSLPFYFIFRLLRGSRSFIALWGIISILFLSFVLYLVAKILDLQATALIYERFWIIVVLIFLIIFQGELKKGLTDIGRMRFFRGLFIQEKRVVGEVVKAVESFAERKTGALIAFERGNSLKPYLGTGTPLDAEISIELLRSIFTTQSPLHDGAVIIRGGRIVAAGCILPITDNPRLSKDLGTRHRAAIGLSEETDAVVVVVSEETGVISIAVEGNIERFIEPEDLRRRLDVELNMTGELDREEDSD